MKKIMLLVFTSLICSQVVYSGDAQRKAELKALIKAQGRSLAGLGNAGIAKLEAVLAALQPAPVEQQDVPAVPHQPAPVQQQPRDEFRAPPPILMHRDALPAEQDDHHHGEQEQDQGICAWASWLFGSCFGTCASLAETVERNPFAACCGLSLCCCCCGYATSTVMATESLAPGVFAACNMCKVGEYACSLITFGCASGACGTNTVVNGCARCVANLARSGHRACLGGHTD